MGESGPTRPGTWRTARCDPCARCTVEPSAPLGRRPAATDGGWTRGSYVPSC